MTYQLIIYIFFETMSDLSCYINWNKLWTDILHQYITEISLPTSFCSSASAEAVQGDFSKSSHYPHQESTHRHPLVLSNFHHWYYFHAVQIKQCNREAYKGQNLRASCDHFCPKEGCQAWCLWKESEGKLMRDVNI